MEKERWNQISTIVDKLLTLDKSEQVTYLQKTLAGQDALIKEVKEYLQAIEASESEQFLESPVEEFGTLFEGLSEVEIPDSAPEKELVGNKIGPFKIEKHIAKGGMGSVFLAHRDDGQFDQEVAIKFINQRNFSEQGQLRFKQEQKILANLRHPNIAMLIDGGVTEDSRPFLILEYVKGIPIDEYCDKNTLNIAQRLELFKKVLNAIEFAHSNLIIHRDLKPNNIFVTEDGEVKILDFGIAKLLDSENDEDLLQTQPGQRLWTPAYAAPEQIGDQPPITQTDVYALGSLLHKLLSNAPAFDFKGKKIREMENIILNDSPVGILKAVEDTDHSEIVDHFGVPKAELLNILKGDLEAIVQKALRKEPEHRYHSISMFLDDILRYENNLPVSAKKNNYKYIAAKFYKRNKKAIVATVVILGSIIAMISYYTLQINEQRKIAELEAKKAQHVSNLLISLFESTNSFSEEGESGLDVKIGSILENSTSLIDKELEEHPEIEADIKVTLGNMYIQLGAFREAEAFITDAIQSLSNLGDDAKLKLAGSYYQLANVYQETGELNKADSLLNEALFIYEESEDGLINKDALATLALYGNLLWFNRGAFSKADSIMQKNLEIRLQNFPEDSTSLAVAYNDLATLNHAQGKFKNAMPYYQKATELYAATLGEHPSLAVALSNYSILLRETFDLDQAESTQRKALQIHREKTGEENIDVGLGMGNLGDILMQKGQLTEADSLIQNAAAMLKGIYGEIHPYIMRTQLTSAKIKVRQKQYDQAEELLLKLVDDYQKSYPEGHPRHADPMLHLGELYLTMNQLQEAELFLSKAYEIRSNGYSENNWRTALTMSAYGEALSKVNKREKADQLLAQSTEILKSAFGEEDPRTKKSIARLLSHQGN